VAGAWAQVDPAYPVNHHSDQASGNSALEVTLRGGGGGLKLAQTDSDWGALFRFRQLHLWLTVMGGQCSGLTLSVVHEAVGSAPVYERPLPVDVRGRWLPIALQLEVTLSLSPQPSLPLSLHLSLSLPRCHSHIPRDSLNQSPQA
jgi:hypothetical protein